MPVTLCGAEVVLRPMTLDDIEALAAAAGESREQYGFTVVPDGKAQAGRYVATALRQAEAGERMPFTILWRDRIVGTSSYWEITPWQWSPYCPLQRTDRPDVVEIGSTWLAASAQRTRCNTEAKYLLLAQAFDSWDVHRVAFRTDERNIRSRSAITRLGAQFEGIRRADKPASDDVVRNSALYSIIRDEWPDVRKRLLARLDAPAISR